MRTALDAEEESRPSPRNHLRLHCNSGHHSREKNARGCVTLPGKCRCLGAEKADGPGGRRLTRAAAGCRALRGSRARRQMTAREMISAVFAHLPRLFQRPLVGLGRAGSVAPTPSRGESLLTRGIELRNVSSGEVGASVLGKAICHSLGMGSCFPILRMAVVSVSLHSRQHLLPPSVAPGKRAIPPTGDRPSCHCAEAGSPLISADGNEASRLSPLERASFPF